MCVGSLCQLLDAGSLKAAAPAAPTASWIRDLHTGSTWSPAKRCSCCRRLCKVTSDCFPFQRQPLWKKLFPLRTQGKWGDGWEPTEAFVDGKGLLGAAGQVPLLASYFDLTGFQGALPGQAYKMCLQWFRAP